MVLGAGPADVETVIVGGDVIKRGSQLVGDHVSKARRLMLASRERLRAREAAAESTAARV
jgi:5-methylthioadenosine/S-adenosylhomocysteine deaminase